MPAKPKLSCEGLTPERAAEAVREHGSASAAADALGIPRTTLRRRLARTQSTKPRPDASATTSVVPVRLTHESLRRALIPANNCKVRAFLDWLADPESCETVEAALADNPKDVPGKAICDWLAGELEKAGIPKSEIAQRVPGTDAIADHRAGRRPCRCRG